MRVRTVLLVPAPLQLIIFDCDGVLVDSERIAVQVDVAMLAELGWQISSCATSEVALSPRSESPGQRSSPRMPGALRRPGAEGPDQ